MRRRRNPSESNPYGIDDRVWSRIVGSETPTIDKIMFAAALDPLMLVDLDMIQPPRSLAECVQLGEMGTRGNLETYLRSVLIKRVMSDVSRVEKTLNNIALWEIRLGVWCAAACAESVLRFVTVREVRPRLAVEAAKGWVLGVIDADAARAAERAAANVAAADFEYSASSVASAAASHAANAAVMAAYSVAARDAASAYAASASAAATAAHAAYAAAYRAADSATYAARSADVFICEAIAHAIDTYPVEKP